MARWWTYFFLLKQVLYLNNWPRRGGRNLWYGPEATTYARVTPALHLRYCALNPEINWIKTLPSNQHVTCDFKSHRTLPTRTSSLSGINCNCLFIPFPLSNKNHAHSGPERCQFYILKSKGKSIKTCTKKCPTWCPAHALLYDKCHIISLNTRLEHTTGGQPVGKLAFIFPREFSYQTCADAEHPSMKRSLMLIGKKIVKIAFPYNL